MSVRRLLWVLVAAILVLAACGDATDDTGATTLPGETTTGDTTAPGTDPPPEETTTTAATATTMPAGEPETGGTLVIAISEDPGNFNPGITTSFSVHAVTGSMFNGLVELDDNANPSPDLAESWEVNDDSTSYTFNLAEGVQWHDGEPFTSADVKFTFEEILLNFHSRTKAGLENVLESIETPDDSTVVFNFNQPYAPLLQRLNSTEAPILPMHVYEGVEDVQAAEANLTPVGTGPFVFSSREIDSEVRLTRNENYFKDGLPYVDEVVFRVIPDQNTQVLALEEGEVDFIWRVPGSDVERLSANADITLHQVNSGPGGGFCIPTVTFNLDREIFEDVRVRQAIAHAVDREQILAQAAFGQGNVATGPISSQMAFAYTDDVTMYPRDVAGANALLDEAGLAPGDDGTRFGLDILVFSSFQKYAEIMRENLAEVGIDLEVVVLERSAFLPRVFGERDFDMNIISYCNNSDPTIGVTRMYVSDNIGDIPFSNGAGYVNPTIDDLFAQAAGAPTTQARAALYAEIQQILTDELPYWWLVESKFVAGSRAAVHGLAPSSGHVAEAAWIEGGGP